MKSASITNRLQCRLCHFYGVLTAFKVFGNLPFICHISDQWASDITCVIIPRHFKKCGVLCYTLRKKFALECPSVRPSVSASFPCSNLSIHRPFFFKLCIGVYIRKEWFGIEDGQISSNKYRVIALDLL